MIYNALMCEHPSIGQPTARMLHPNLLWAEGEDRNTRPDLRAMRERVKAYTQVNQADAYYTNIEHIPLSPWQGASPHSRKSDVGRDTIRDIVLAVRDVTDKPVMNYGELAALGANEKLGGRAAVEESWKAGLMDRASDGRYAAQGYLEAIGAVTLQGTYFKHASIDVYIANLVHTVQWFRSHTQLRIAAFMWPMQFDRSAPLDMRTWTSCFDSAKALVDDVYLWAHPQDRWENIEGHVRQVLK